MRVVSLCPSLTETLFALGAGQAVVGRTRFCVEPARDVARVERVGGTKDPRLERIRELAPDVVLMNEEENRREDAEALRALGLRVHSSFPRGPEEVPGVLRSIGALLERRAEAERWAARVEAELAAARARPPAERTRFAVLVWRRPWMAAGTQTYLGALMESVGGSNVVPGRYPELRLEDLRTAGPERVFLPSEPYRFRESHRVEVAALVGLSAEAVALVDGRALTWHGVRTVEGVGYAAEVLGG